MNKIAIIGCGAAGMMAAIAAAEAGASVVIYEKNEKAGKKIYITGKGRCNVTNTCETEKFFSHVRRNPKFLYSSVYSYDAGFVQDFFESHGCPLKEERGGRVFPVSDHSSDIIRTLSTSCRDLGVTIHYNTEVTGLTWTDGQVDGRQCITGVKLSGGKTEQFDEVIICTGGLSYPSTGSTGDGYRFAKALGHSVEKGYPSLVPFEIYEDWYRDLQGLSLKNVSLRMERADTAKVFGKKNKPLYEEQGEMLFTHFGISGPLILTASTLYVPGIPTKLHLDLKPALTEVQLDKRILRDFDAQKNKQLQNALGGLYPAKLIPVIIALAGLDPQKKVNEITHEERQCLVHITKDLEMNIKGTRGFPEAIITKGGISVGEVDSSTMESKLCKGLYFAGEVLDVDAVTGGYNLQIAWSTGHLAGQSAAYAE